MMTTTFSGREQAHRGQRACLTRHSEWPNRDSHLDLSGSKRCVSWFIRHWQNSSTRTVCEWELPAGLSAQCQPFLSLSDSAMPTSEEQDLYVFTEVCKKMTIFYVCMYVCTHDLLCQKWYCTVSRVCVWPGRLLLSFLELVFTSGSSSGLCKEYYWVWESQCTPLRMASGFSRAPSPGGASGWVQGRGDD